MKALCKIQEAWFSLRSKQMSNFQSCDNPIEHNQETVEEMGS